MKGGSEASAIARWLALAGSEPDDRMRASLGYDALVFAEKSANRGAWRKALEGWGMVRSETMEQTRHETRIEEKRGGHPQLLARRFRQEPPDDWPTRSGPARICPGCGRGSTSRSKRVARRLPPAGGL